MATTEDTWDYQEQWARRNDEDALCLLDLRRRVEALEQRAATEESSATEPPSLKARVAELDAAIEVSMNRIRALVANLPGRGPAPAPAAAAYRPLWREVRGAMQAVPGEFDWVAAQLAVADWLAAREHCGAASALRIEARRAREGA